jgi:phosphonate transport system substrate-binding protein
MTQRRTYHEVNELLRHGQVDLAIICTGAYLSASTEKTPLEVIAVPVYAEGPVYHSFFLVGAQSGIESLEQLRGRRFAFSDPLSLSGRYYPLYALLDRGLDPGTFFSETTFTYSHDGNMRAVLDGIVDAAAVDSLVYEFDVRRNPDLAKRLRIIHRSPPLGVSPFVVPKSLDADLRLSLQEALFSATDDPQGQRALSELTIERFAAPQSGLYDDAAKVFAEVRAHLEKRQ